MKLHLTKVLILNSVIFLNITACHYPGILSKPPGKITTFNQDITLKNRLNLAQKIAHKWSSKAIITGAYDIVFNHTRFLSYEFISPAQPNQQLSIKINQDLSHSTRITDTPLLNHAFPTTNWNTSAREALALSRNAGFKSKNNIGIGLSFWNGMGIQKKSLKWSVLSFGENDTTQFYVVDDQSQKVWTCENANATSGCLPFQKVKSLFQAFQ